jgi:molybdopterin-guanine dinucleotide biosynthesis protein A
VDIAWPSRRIAGSLLAGKGGRVLEDADGQQHLVALWPVASSLVAVRLALDSGERAVHAVLEQIGLETVSIAPERIGNLNTVQDMEQMP